MVGQVVPHSRTHTQQMGCFRAGLTCVHPGCKGAPFPNSHKGAAWAPLGQAGCAKEVLCNGRTGSEDFPSPFQHAMTHMHTSESSLGFLIGQGGSFLGKMCQCCLAGFTAPLLPFSRDPSRVLVFLPGRASHTAGNLPATLPPTHLPTPRSLTI